MITLLRVAGFVTLLALAFAVAFQTEGLDWETLIDIPLLMFVVLGTAGITMIGADSRQWKSAVACVLLSSAYNNEEKRRQAQNFFKVASRAALTNGAISFLLSLFIMGANMSDPSSIGAGVAVSLLAPLYGIVLSEMIFHPLAAALDSRDSDAGNAT